MKWFAGMLHIYCDMIWMSLMCVQRISNTRHVLLCGWVQRVTATTWARQVQCVTSSAVSARVVRTWPLRRSWPAMRPRPTRAARCVRLATTAWRPVTGVHRATAITTAAVRCSAQRTRESALYKETVTATLCTCTECCSYSPFQQII